MDNNQKPLILLRKECYDNLSEVINNSQLPAFILEPILKDMLQQVQRAMNAEYNAALSYYNHKNSKEDGANT